MSRLLCCVRARRDDMGAALSQAQEGEACDGAGLAQAPPTMADVIRERKKKAGGAALGTLRRRIAAAARRPRDARPDRGCEHARFIRSVVSSWRLAEVFLLCEELEAGAALRDLVTQAELAREPAAALHADLARAYSERWWCDVELCGGVRAHRAVLAARCSYFRDLLQRHPPSTCVVPLDGPWQALTRAELAACVGALYAGAAPSAHHYKWEHGAADEDLDIISGDGAYSYRSRSLCRCGGAEAARVSRLAAVLGFSPGALHHDMRYLLESGEMADCRLSWGAYELPAHRLVLAARSRYFRSVMSRRTPGAGGAGAALVCVDEKVLPRRFAKALLHCAYTDQVDLSLIGRNCSSPSSANSSSSSGTAWAGVVGGRSRAASAQALDDACQLYEIARFLEMPIVVQGCEDAIIEALSADTLPAVLRWAAAPHASRWVQRQAMRYLRDEFPQAMAGAAAARLPRTALAAALASPFLQASEAHALRALLRWAERAALTAQPKQTRPPAEPNVVWHTAHSVSRRGARRREVSDAALREVLAALVPHVRLEHLPPDHELLQQMIRRGLVTPPSGDAAGGSADAWLGRGANRPARCFLPHLDELKALLECQAPPEAELARLRRARYMHRIPDTLYMVAAARGAGGAAAGATATGAGATGAAGACEGACVSPRVLATMRARMRELRTSAPAARALQLHAHDAHTVLTQIALRTVREMSLPDSCADLLLNDDSSEREREWESPGSRRRGWERDECCRRPRPGPPHATHATQPHAALRQHTSADDQLALSQDNSRTSTCRREPSRSAENAQHRQSLTMCYSRGAAAGGASAARLSARVPDVAMAPNANTHLLSAPAYAHPPAHAHAHTAHPAHPAHLTEYGSGGVLQLDLGDGATHTPRPGSRAARAAAGASASRLSARRADDDDLRAAIELSVMRAYSSFHPRAHSPSLAPQLHARCRATYTLPHAPPSAPPPPPHAAPAAPAAPHAGRPRASPSPSALSASNSGHLAHHRPSDERVGSGSGSGSGGGLHALGALAGVSSASSSPSASPSPRRHKLPPPREYRLEYGAGGSRGSSPGGYA